MARFSNYPTLYDECNTVSISFLKQHQYLTPGTYKSGCINWSINGKSRGSISIAVNTFADQPYLELNYKIHDKPINYKVNLITVTSNIGKGVVWFFICPVTGKRCRKLYLVGTYFLHREAFTGCMYDKQKQSKKWRNFDALFGSLFTVDDAYEKIDSKYFKTHYAGKPTKRYQRLMKKINTANKPISKTEFLTFFR